LKESHFFGFRDVSSPFLVWSKIPIDSGSNRIGDIDLAK
jgi:hypothetical protein